MVSEQALIIIFYGREAVCMENNGKDIKHTRHVSKIMQLVRNSQELNLHKTVWCEVGLQLADIGTNNVREDELNPILRYAMLILEHLQNIFTRGVIQCSRVWRKMCSGLLDWIELRIQLNEFEMFI